MFSEKILVDKNMDLLKQRTFFIWMLIILFISCSDKVSVLSEGQDQEEIKEVMTEKLILDAGREFYVEMLMDNRLILDERKTDITVLRDKSRDQKIVRPDKKHIQDILLEKAPPICVIGTHQCRTNKIVRECKNQAGKAVWIEHFCPKNTLCKGGSCQSGCLDECALGQEKTYAGKRQICKLYSDIQKRFIKFGKNARNLARRHDAWVRKFNLANGYVADTFFTNTNYSKILRYAGTVDSAEWTGVYLVAESLRYMTTHSPDAKRNLETLVEKIYQLFEITGDPGSMARFWAPIGVNALWNPLNEKSNKNFHQTIYKGHKAFWHGSTSRDMYHGAILGCALAYDALTSLKHKEMIRKIVVPLARELIKIRKQVPVIVRFYSFGKWNELSLKYDLQYVVPVSQELTKGSVLIQIGSKQDPSDYNASDFRGVREFFPDFSKALKQTPIIGGLIPAIPRASSAVMLASILRLAIHVSKGVSAYAKDYQAIKAHYDAKKYEWLKIMKQYAYLNESKCWKQYFGITIMYHPIFNLLYVEKDAVFRQAVLQQVLLKQVWSVVKEHKNLYFTYVTASQASKGFVSSKQLQEAEKQLKSFVAPPKAQVLVDNTAHYPHHSKCPKLSSKAIDVGTRVAKDFLWQHHPFYLKTEIVAPQLVYPGVDYLVAYWLGRYYGYVADDAPQTCLRWASK